MLNIPHIYLRIRDTATPCISNFRLGHLEWPMACCESTEEDQASANRRRTVAIRARELSRREGEMRPAATVAASR
jgi:hypothetical protein